MTKTLTPDVPVPGLGKTESVSSSELPIRTRDALAQVKAGVAVRVTHYNEVVGYLLAPDAVQGIVDRAVEHRDSELRSTLPLLLAAATAGVAIPSETLSRLVPGLDNSWEAVAHFAASFPVELTRGEGGEPIAHGRLRGADVAIEEFGDDADLNFDA